MISNHGIIRRAVSSDRFYPLSFWKDVLGLTLTPVLAFKGEIDENSLMVHRWMKGKHIESPLNRNPYYHGTRMYTTVYYPALDIFGEEMYKGIDARFYIDFYQDKSNMQADILHHNFCVLSINS